MLVPQLPLVWSVTWLSVMTVWQGLGRVPVKGTDVQESVLIILGVVLLANIYNLTFLCYRLDFTGHHGRPILLVIVDALVLISSTVLAWGQPRNVALPSQLNGWTSIFIILNGGQALLGVYFVTHYRRQQAVEDAARLSPWVMPTYLLLVGFLLPPFLSSGKKVALILGLVAIISWQAYHWRNLARFFAAVPARQSGIYEMVLGVELAGTIMTLFFGFDTAVLRNSGGRLDLISYCLVICLLAAGVASGILAAMQRYHWRYEYGAARRHPLRFLYGGALLLSLCLILACLLVGK